MPEPGNYLYCIIRCPSERTFGEAQPIGGGPGMVYALAHHGLAAVVSESPTEDYDTTRANMMAHQRVLEEVMREFVVLPVRFGTVAPSTPPDGRLRLLLEKRGLEFDRLLSEMEGKEELGLKASWRDERLIFQELLAENPGMRRLRDSLQDRPPEATRMERIRLGEMAKELLDRKRDAEAARILSPLRPIARRVKENSLLADRMIVNAAFLVEKTRAEEFDQRVRDLDREMGHRVSFKYVGPVPPYNFVNIAVNWREL